jgi:D-inositol-3-phosphate glycosyltransferase
MRIALVSDPVIADDASIEVPSGENVGLTALAQALAGRGHEVTVYVPRGDQDPSGAVEASGGYVVHWVEVGPAARVQGQDPLPSVPAFRQALGAQWAKNRPDVAHARSWVSGLACVAAARDCQVPMVQTFRGLGRTGRANLRHSPRLGVDVPPRRRLERALVHTVDRIVASCTNEVYELRQLGLRRGQARIVPSGVDTDRFRPEGPVARRGRRSRLLTVGGLDRHQGVDDIVQVLPALPEVELVVAGGRTADRTGQGPDAARIQRAAVRLGVMDRVVLLGPVSRQQLPALYRSADLVVQVPWDEAFGLAPLEAMACARPVVATAVGGHVDTVVAGVTGELTDSGDLTMLARCLRELLADPVRREGYGQAGADRAQARYRWERIAEETEQVYAELLTDAVPHGTAS